jgi:hypothetical protein
LTAKIDNHLSGLLMSSFFVFAFQPIKIYDRVGEREREREREIRRMDFRLGEVR